MALEVGFLAVGGGEISGDAIEFFVAIHCTESFGTTARDEPHPIGFLCRNAGGLVCKTTFAADRKEMD
jgi:hypothetical protein